MLIFIDDSGDPGFEIEKGATEFFVISLVIFEDNLEAEKTAIAIKELKRELGFKDYIEFKFSQSKHSVRKKFLEKVKPFNFKVRSLVVDKRVIYSEELRNNKNSFYSYTIKTVLKNSRSIINAKIKIDGSGNRDFKRSFLTYLRKELNSSEKKFMEQCRLVDSKDNVLIQMADMIAGTVRRSFDSLKPDGKELKKIIKSKIEDEWKYK